MKPRSNFRYSRINDYIDGHEESPWPRERHVKVHVNR